MKQRVFDFLERSPVAQVSAHMEMGEGCAVSIWENTRDKISYVSPAQHTFSLYLKGGMGTRRTDINSGGGYPGAICVMPEGCGSDWEITAPFRFFHLYLSDARLRGGFVRTHDCDARRLVLEEATFVDSPRLSAPLLQLAQAAAVDDRIYAETALSELYAAFGAREVSVRGGLAPHVLRRVDAWIDAHLDDGITLEALADEVGLSSYHFHRMFRLSRGVAPHAWITECRIARARRLLRGRAPIAQIADECGFSSQSHMTRVFHRYVGVTPADYRARVRS